MSTPPAQQIQQLLHAQTRRIHDQLHSISSVEPLPANKRASIDAQLQHYSQLRPVLKRIAEEESDGVAAADDNSRFWSLNESIEKDVEDKLRHLKQMDNTIDSILNQQFDQCNQVEDIEESIRILLSKGSSESIQEAEPLLNNKNTLLKELEVLKHDKERVKDSKLSTIKELLDLLSRLKQHRQSRLQHCRTRKITAESMARLRQFIRDLNELMSRKETVRISQGNYKKLQKSVEYSNQRIVSLGEEIAGLLQEQGRTLKAMEQLVKENSLVNYKENRLFELAGMKSDQLSSWLEKLPAIVIEQQEKRKDFEQIEHSLSTTTQTIQIFQHIQLQIETQNKRKAQLMGQLAQLQSQHQAQTHLQDTINDLEAETERLAVEHQRLNKKMSSSANQADLSAYKSLSSGISEIEKEAKVKQSKLKELQRECNERSKALLGMTNDISQEYRDILSEVVPQVWFRNHDFGRQESIQDLNLYLKRTIYRFSVTE